MKTSTSIIALAMFELLATPAFAQATPPEQTSQPDQTATTTPSAVDAATNTTDAATNATPAAATPDTGLGEIVVTATKRETNLQRTPIAISVLNTQALKDRHVQSLYDLADGAVPSLRVATFEARQSALTVGIRGIVPLDANQPAREQGVGIYIDGVYLGRQHGLNAALFDVERIEVLKGPQGTLFGRNTEGGALSIVTKAPTGVFGGRIIGGIGNAGSRNGEVHLDLPEVSGFSVKLDGVIQHQDATTSDPFPGSTGWNYYNRKGGRAAVRWKPTTEITDDFSYDVAEDKNTPFYSQLLNYDPNNCRAANGSSNQAPFPVAGSACVTPGTAFTGLGGSNAPASASVKPLLPGVVVNGSSRQKVADIGVPQVPSVDKTHGFTNILRYKLSPELELRSITAWRGVTATQFDNSGGAHRVPVVNLTAACAGANCAFSRYSLADLRQNQFSQEFQAVGTVGPVDYVAGLYYFNEHVSDDAATPNSLGATAIVDGTGAVTGANYAAIYPGTCAIANPDFNGKAVQGCSIDRASEVRSKSYAAYGQITYNATDALHITVGGRYTHDKKNGELTYSRNINYRDPANATKVTANGYQPLDKSWDRFNPTATVAYDFSNAVHAYAKYATGYRAGGASSRTSNYQAFNPEDIKSYEIGLKTDLFDRRVRVNLAGYIMDRKNSQVDLSTIQPTATGNFNNLVTFNAPGITKIRGIEADVTVNPFEGLTLSASYAYTYTDIPLIPVTYTAPGVVIAPATTATPPQSTTVPQKFYIVFTPRNAASGSADYSYPLMDNGTKLRLHVDANYSQSTQAFDQFATHNDSSFIVNGRIALADIPFGGRGNRFTLSAWGRNLFDYQYVFRRDPSNSIPAVQTSQVVGVPNITAIGNINGVLGDYGNFNAPRTYGLEATIAF